MQGTFDILQLMLLFSSSCDKSECLTCSKTYKQAQQSDYKIWILMFPSTFSSTVKCVEFKGPPQAGRLSYICLSRGKVDVTGVDDGSDCSPLNRKIPARAGDNKSQAAGT